MTDVERVKESACVDRLLVLQLLQSCWAAPSTGMIKPAADHAAASITFACISLPA